MKDLIRNLKKNYYIQGNLSCYYYYIYMGCTRRCSQPEVVVTENYAPKLGRQGGSRVNSLLKNRNNIENKKIYLC